MLEAAERLQGGGGEDGTGGTAPQAGGEHGGGAHGGGVEGVVGFVAVVAAFDPFGQRRGVAHGLGGEQVPHGADLLDAGAENAEFAAETVDLGAVAVFFASGGGEGVVEAVGVFVEALRGGGGVGHEQGELFGDLAVLPQPLRIAAAVVVGELGGVAEVELPFVEAVEQGGGGFVGQVG